MSKRQWFAAVLLPVALAVAGPAQADMLPGPVEARVIDVIDGDSLRVRAQIWLSQEVETIVRLDGVDAPELRARCDVEKETALAARAFLERQVAAADRRVLLTGISQDKFGGRVLATVTDATGHDLARALTEAGLARVYRGGRRAPWCP